MALYEIAFSGQCLPGTDREAVKAKVGQLFRADAQRIELLFSGRRLVIKSQLDAAGAERFRQALERAGAVGEVCAMASVEAIDLAPPPPVDRGPRAQVIPRDRYMAAFVDVDAPAYDIAEAGALMQVESAPVQAPRLDLSQLSLAPVGADLGTSARPAAPAAPDVSHLKLAP
ncbi:hypothetical protein [Pseudomonas sp. RIT-PI-S]|uniref:hypothetical protein n=1 Tax=Pseudomonas sp. RIT-PI-S TaxID=3035295 RepID=UPI0021DAEA85|nr:hypothetical protein [Pseudomonas sp. RIT-PI-S]